MQSSNSAGRLNEDNKLMQIIDDKERDDLVHKVIHIPSSQQQFGQEIDNDTDFKNVLVDDYFARKSVENKQNKSKSIERIPLDHGNVNYLYQRFKSFARRQDIEAEIDSEDSAFMKFLKLLLYFTIHKPFTIMRNLTVPMQEEEDWNRSQAAISFPICYVVFLYFTEGKIN